MDRMCGAGLHLDDPGRLELGVWATVKHRRPACLVHRFYRFLDVVTVFTVEWQYGAEEG